jgi:hypothetical protein
MGDRVYQIQISRIPSIRARDQVHTEHGDGTALGPRVIALFEQAQVDYVMASFLLLPHESLLAWRVYLT